MKTKDEQLQEAAQNIKKKLLNETPVLTAAGHNDFLLDKNVMLFALMVAKSDAAKSYHTQPMDVEELRKKFYNFNDSSIKKIFDFFLPYLQPSNVSDAVEFSEWMFLNTVTYINDIKYRYIGGQLCDIDELYSEFIKSKNK